MFFFPECYPYAETDDPRLAEATTAEKVHGPPTRGTEQPQKGIKRSMDHTWTGKKRGRTEGRQLLSVKPMEKKRILALKLKLAHFLPL
ncbi:hypothetical protein JTE90_006891 [Oedothorax gibbosus]|uniref:Uncharacterized protein n=1 Tax=Oedothorax gibbosus TaxID=931172 RepID=A0AAV6VQW8_9ARAC|nr:hypothetical protein JTE90_006891 [Oedothorax gibbosus]